NDPGRCRLTGLAAASSPSSARRCQKSNATDEIKRFSCSYGYPTMIGGRLRNEIRRVAETKAAEMKLKSHWWWDLSAEDFRRLDMSRIVAVLPIGAVEQHGPHLPVRVDTAIVD